MWVIFASVVDVRHVVPGGLVEKAARFGQVKLAREVEVAGRRHVRDLVFLQ